MSCIYLQYFSTMNISECNKSTFRGTYTRMLLGVLCRIDELSRAKKKKLTTVERMRRIKLGADLSLAFTSHGTAWSRAVIIKHASQQKRNKHLVKEMLGKKRLNDMMRIKRSNAYYYIQRFLCSRGLAGRMKQYLKAPMILTRKIIHRSIHRKNVANIPVKPSAYIDPFKTVANQRKLRQLKRVIPGGESINGSACLLREAADYIVSLRTQVEVMHSIAYHSATQPETL